MSRRNWQTKMSTYNMGYFASQEGQSRDRCQSIDIPGNTERLATLLCRCRWVVVAWTCMSVWLHIISLHACVRACVCVIRWLSVCHVVVCSMGYIGPVSVLVFFIISTVINKFLMSPVVALVFLQEQLEGDFRCTHVHGSQIDKMSVSVWWMTDILAPSLYS